MPIPVTCALIVQQQKVLAVRRSETMPLSGFWEFPGGKLEIGESPEDCIVREIREELGVDIVVLDALPSSDYAYTPNKVIRLIPFTAQVLTGSIQLHEHDQLRWLALNELFEVTWAPADVAIVEYVEKFWNDLIS